MNTLLSFFTALMDVGNWAFWLDIVLIITMATIVFFYGEIKYVLPSLKVEKHPFLQKVLRFSFLMSWVVGPFVEFDYWFYGMNVILKTCCVYASAFFALNVVMLGYLIMVGIIYVVGNLIYWALDKKWPYD